MIHVRLVTAALVASLAAAAAPAARAQSAGDAGPSVVVPFVISDAIGATAVVVENHEARAVEVQLRWVGEASSGSPGLTVCGKTRLAPNSLTPLRFASACSLTSPDLGMAIVLATTPSGIARLSARGIVVLAGGGSVMVDGIPLASLESTDVTHVVSGLSWDPSGATTPDFTTDCLFGTFFDGSGAGGALVRFGLRDPDGQPIGKDVLTAVKPFSLTRFADVFKLVGAPPQAWEGVRAIFAPAGGGDSAVGYCTATALTASGSTLTYAVAQVDEPQEATRRRAINVGSTPEAQGGAPFSIDPADTQILHGLLVRHPDRFSCAVRASDELFLALIPPDGATRFGGNSRQTGWFDTGPRSTVNSGVAGLWVLEVSWGRRALRIRPVAYTIDCRSGNGVSLADELFRN